MLGLRSGVTGLASADKLFQAQPSLHHRALLVLHNTLKQLTEDIGEAWVVTGIGHHKANNAECDATTQRL